jgi:aspartyl-tRNA(Asn)/glutamyl-tRNA(Gln) amidotransferase subunit C
MASSIEEPVVRHMAHLARLRLTDDEVARLAGELSRILEYVNKLNELNTTHVPPTAHALPTANVFREDEVRPPESPDRALQDAPESQDGLFRVPKVLDQEST